MNKFFLVVVSTILLLLGASPTQATYVNDYWRSDGTYVQSHYRSNPNGLLYDNYSWTPSQPLYNNSYGRYNTYRWNTPAWNWQDDYWTGLDSYSTYNDYNGWYDSYDYDYYWNY